MAYRKFRGLKLFTGKSWAPEDSVLIMGENERVEAIVPAMEAGDDVQFFEGIISPGFVNAHCHLELSHMKGLIPPHSGMIPFLLGVMGSRQADPDRIAAAMEEAHQEMLTEGIVAVGDICNTTDSLPIKRNSQIRYHSFVEVSGFVGATADIRYGQALAIREKLKEADGASITPHAPYSVSPELFKKITIAEPEALLSMHNQESPDEDNFFLSGKSAMTELYAAIGVPIDFFNPPKTSSIKAVFPYLKHSRKTILVHNVTTSMDDLEFIEQEQENEIFFCVCPSANQYINQLLPPEHLLQTVPDKIVIGTDSLASNYRLSIIEELKILATHYPFLPMETLLGWATLNGARALDMETELGSFEKGKKPGVLVLSDWKVKRLL